MSAMVKSVNVVCKVLIPEVGISDQWHISEERGFPSIHRKIDFSQRRNSGIPIRREDEEDIQRDTYTWMSRPLKR